MESSQSEINVPSCDESKPGDVTDPLIFPWLSEERIFEIGDAPPLEEYSDFYSRMATRDPSAAYSIITMNTGACVCSCTMIADLRYILDMDKLKEQLRECEDDSSTIAIRLGLAWVDNIEMKDVKSVHSSYADVFPYFDRVRTGEIILHANLLLVDRKDKTIERFEPNALPHALEADIRRYESIDATVKRDILPLLGEGYRYCDPLSFCPIGGPQGDDEYCAAWSIFYMHLRLTNPNLSRKELTRRLNDLSRVQSPLVDYLEVMKNTYEAIDSRSIVYSPSQLERLYLRIRDMTDRGFVPALTSIMKTYDSYMRFLARGPPNYGREPKATMFWLDLIHVRAVWRTEGSDIMRYLVNGRLFT